MTVFLAVLLLWIVSLVLHEYAHARVAFQGGDFTVAKKGYLTMNPFAYMDPVHSLILPLVFLLMGGLALPGGAVWIDRTRLRSRAWESGVSLAGPAANVVLCLLLALPFAFGLGENGAGGMAAGVLAFGCYLQFIAVALNLLPVPGLDGYGALEPWLPRSVVEALRPFRQYGIFLLFILFMSTGLDGFLFGRVGGAVMRGLGVPAEALYLGYTEFFFWKKG